MKNLNLYFYRNTIFSGISQSLFEILHPLFYIHLLDHLPWEPRTRGTSHSVVSKTEKNYWFLCNLHAIKRDSIKYAKI